MADEHSPEATLDNAGEIREAGSDVASETPSADWTIRNLPPDVTDLSVSLDVEPIATLEWNNEDDSAALAYPVVGIGASAGGLKAFQELLENLPEKTGMA